MRRAWPTGAAALFLAATSPAVNLFSVVLGGATGLLLFMLVAILRPHQIGGGDVKLAALIGLLFGFPYGLWALMVGVISAGITAMVLLLTKRSNRQTQIPYAPFLCLGAMVALFYNPPLSLAR